MGDIINCIKVRVCFKCKQYTHIYPDNPNNERFIRFFDIWHSGHPIQTVNINEIDNSYECINEKKRQKIIEEILNE